MRHKYKDDQMSTRYAIYSRYSTDLQNDRSIEDQVDTCKAILKDGDEIVKLYSDRAMSGTLMHKRTGLLSLLTDTENNHFDVVLSESLDRLSRDMENISHIYKICTFYGVNIKTIHEGEISAFHVGISGAMSTMNMKQLKERIKRGLRGNIRSGKHAGGITYGYKIKPYNDQGVLERGLREIIPEQAENVRFIFNEYAKGVSPAAIARSLNMKGELGPRGKEWIKTTILGYAKMNSGIISNPIFKGDIVWGKRVQQWHPITNKRVYLARPTEEWERNRAEHLQIVSEELWNSCQYRRKYDHIRKKNMTTRNTKKLNLVCGRCDRKMRQPSYHYFRCVNHELHRKCEQTKYISLPKLFF